jgi:PKD repeat protein
VTVSDGISFSYDAPPMASAGDDITTNLTGGEAVVEFDASNSWDDSGIVEYIWYVGDLSIETSPSPMLTYTFNSTGIYYVSLEVVDDGGNSSEENAELSTLIVKIE